MCVCVCVCVCVHWRCILGDHKNTQLSSATNPKPRELFKKKYWLDTGITRHETQGP